MIYIEFLNVFANLLHAYFQGAFFFIQMAPETHLNFL